ncbi:trna delta -isopentenylpyrophosphate transferase [Methylobacterium ajmalii]|uniref:trna delta -isopentenylpyrophosphate transferase n=1 Tax=Methylobacterium ajmalii TaxID=2738439 RepID=UPI002F36022F
MNKEQIRTLFSTHGVPLGAKDVWEVQGTPVIKHSALERLSAALKLVWDLPREVVVGNQDVVVLVSAKRTDGIMEWSYGECSVVREGVQGNYKVSGRQAAYPWAMAEKRGKDRVIIKLAGLHGAYSDEEADDFKDALRNGKAEFGATAPADEQSGDEEPARPPAEEKAPARRGRPPKAAQSAPAPAEEPRQEEPPHEELPPLEEPEGEPEREEAPPPPREPARAAPKAANDAAPPPEPNDGLKGKIDRAKTINAVTDLMLAPETQSALAAMPPALRDEVREYAKSRLVSLGWPARNTKAAAR